MSDTTRLLDTFRDRFGAHTAEEREAARARARVAGSNFRRIEKLYEAAVAERKAAAAHASSVGVGLKSIAADMEIDHGTVSRLVRDHEGERTTVKS